VVGGTIVRSAPHQRQGGGLGGFLALLFGLVVVLALVGVGGYFYARNVYTQAGPATTDGKPRVVMIQPGSSAPAN
jgi:hypothetical protein